MFSDPTFWTAVAFVIIILAIGRQAYRTVTSGLDKRAEEIRRREIEQYGKRFHDHEWERLEKFSESLLNKVVFDLTANLKTLNLESDEELRLFDAVCRGLGLDPTDDDQKEKSS